MKSVVHLVLHTSSEHFWTHVVLVSSHCTLQSYAVTSLPHAANQGIPSNATAVPNTNCRMVKVSPFKHS